MSTQPLTKSDWDGHPVWWVRFDRHTDEPIDLLVLKLTTYGAVTFSRFFDWKQLAQDGCQRSHDRIHWEPCNKPALLQLREGAWYERRDGKIVGPLKKNSSNLPNARPFAVDRLAYENGKWNYEHEGDSDYDLIREVPPPRPCTISKAEADKHTVTENRVAQPDTVDVEKLIEALSAIASYDEHSPYGKGVCNYGCDCPNIARHALAALHPRLKEEVDRG